MVPLIRRLALPIAITSLAVNLVMLIVSCVIWWWAAAIGHTLNSVTFVSNVSMLALVFAAVSGVAGGLAGVLALIPTDDLLEG